MADILTHLRELSFGYGILQKKIDNFPNSPKEFLSFCKNNIVNTEHLTTKDISIDKLSFSQIEINTIQNGLKLANYVLSKNIIINEDPVVKWTGIETQSGSTADIIIDDIPFSLKEESFILHNMGLYQLLNIILDKVIYKRGLHIFEQYAPNDLNKWFEITRDIMIKQLEENSFQGQDSKRRNIKLSYSRSADKLYLFFKDNEEYIHNFSTCDYSQFKEATSSKYREKVFSKFIKEKLSSNSEYLKYKKICSEKAGENLIEYLKVELNANPSPSSLYNLFRIEQKPYYFAKTTNKSVELYKVPSRDNFSTKVKIIDITSNVPKSQLNIYTTFENIYTNEKLIVRNELRYSHGQFNGTPEAKQYTAKGSLLIAYEEV